MGFRFRRDSSNNWTTANPVLGQGEFGLDLNGSRIKIGDGVNSWNALSYFSGGGLGSVSGGTTHATGPGFSFANSNGVTFGVNGNTITASAAGGGGGGAALSAGTQSGNTGTIAFSNSNGITFGMSGSNTITASHNGITSQSVQTQSNVQGISAGTTVARTGDVVFSNANGVSFGLNGNTVTATVATNYLTSQSNQALSGSNGSFTFQTATFGALNGVTFYTSNGSLVASHNGLTTARASNDGIGTNTALTAGPLAWTANSAGLSLNAGSAAGTTSGFGGNLISGSMTHNTAGLNLSLNHPAWLTTAAQSNHSHGNPTLALTNLSGTTASNSAGLTLSLSAAAGGGGADGYNILAAGTQTAGTAATVAFANSNGISFGMSNSSQITASHNGIQSIVFNGATTLSGSRLTFYPVSPVYFGAIGAGEAEIGIGLQSNYGVGNTTLSSSDAYAFGVVGSQIYSGAGAVSVGMSDGTVIVSSPVQTNQTVGLYAVSNTTQSSSGTRDARSLSFAGAGIASVGVSGGTVVISVPSGGGGGGIASINDAEFGGGAFTQGFDLRTTGLGFYSADTAANRLYLGAYGPTINGQSDIQNLDIAGLGGVNISTTTGAGVMSITISAPAIVTVGGAELFPLGNNTVFSTLGQNTIYFQKFINQSNVSFNNYELRYSGSTVSSSVSQVAAHTYDYGLYERQTGASSTQYTLNASSRMVFTASFSSNLSAGYTISQGGASHTSTSAGTGLMSALTGFKHLYLPYTSTITAGGQYAVAIRMSSATTVGTSPLRIGIKHQTNYNNLTIGKIGTGGVTATNASHVGDFALGVYSATSSNLPATLAISGLTNAVSQARLYVQFEA